MSVVSEDLGFVRGALLMCGPVKGFRKEVGAFVGEVGYNRYAEGGWAWRVFDVRPARRLGLHVFDEVRLLREGHGAMDACLVACDEALRDMGGGAEVSPEAVWRRLSDRWERWLGLAVVAVFAVLLVGCLMFLVYGVCEWVRMLAAAIGRYDLKRAASILVVGAVVAWIAFRAGRDGQSCGGG